RRSAATRPATPAPTTIASMSEQPTHIDRVPGAEYSGDQLAGSGRRLTGVSLEFVLVVVTLGAGWLAWWVALLPSGPPHGKMVLKLPVVDAWSAAPVGW